MIRQLWTVKGNVVSLRDHQIASHIPMLAGSFFVASRNCRLALERLDAQSD